MLYTHEKILFIYFNLRNQIFLLPEKNQHKSNKKMKNRRKDKEKIQWKCRMKRQTNVLMFYRLFFFILFLPSCQLTYATGLIILQIFLFNSIRLTSAIEKWNVGVTGLYYTYYKSLRIWVGYVHSFIGSSMYVLQLYIMIITLKHPNMLWTFDIFSNWMISIDEK